MFCKSVNSNFGRKKARFAPGFLKNECRLSSRRKTSERMVQLNATSLQASFHIAAGRQRQAAYTAAAFDRGPFIDKSVVLDSTAQRVFRMRKGILTGSRLINARLEQDKRQRWVPVMVTLTYAPDVEWQACHIREYLNRVQMYAGRQGQRLPYAWVMELQKSGNPHYHVIFWIPRKWHLPKSDARGWWPHGSTNTIRANNPYGYLSKYASKADKPGQAFPKGARIHGLGGLTKKEAQIVAWWKLPKDLRLGEEGSHKWKRLKGGGWVCVSGDAAGKVHFCDWGLASIDAVKKRVRLVKKPAPHDPIERVSLVDAWKERVYDDGLAAGSAAVRRLQTYRESWVWSGPDLGYQHPSDAPILELPKSVDRQAIDHYVPLPF